MAEEFKPSEKSMRDILYVLFRHKGKIIFIFLVAVIVTLIILLSQPDIYESNAKILISGSHMSTIEMVTGIAEQGEIRAEIELLTSRGFAEAAVDHIGPEKILFVPDDLVTPLIQLQDFFFTILGKMDLLKIEEVKIDTEKSRESAIDIYMKTIKVNIASRSNIINLIYSALTPELAQEILQKTIEIYREKHIEMRTKAVSLKFLSDETENLRKELDHSIKELKAFQEKINVTSLPEQQAYLVGRITQIKGAIEESEANISGVEAAIEEMKGKLEFRE
jgi:uncharacterized protein involved in exopolysaccharide biosynthesis